MAKTLDLLRKGEKFVRIFFIIIYGAGICGILNEPTREAVASLTPFALMLSFIFVILYHGKRFDIGTFLVFLAIYSLSFFIEMIGVKHGFIFGNYTYGESLGYKISGTPLMIGVNWLMLVYSTAIVSERLNIIPGIRIIISSMIMLIYDMIMEQSAGILDMWHWEGGEIPLRNYVSWFIVSLMLHGLLRLTDIRNNNRFAIFILICQGIFFLAIYIFIK